MGTSYNRLGEAVVTGTHNLCFGAKKEKKKKKNRYSPAKPSCFYKIGVKWGYLCNGHVFLMGCTAISRSLTPLCAFDHIKHATSKLLKIIILNGES